MNISFDCPGCGARFEAPASLAGKKARCKRCRGEITIPAGSTPKQAAGAGGRVIPERSLLAAPVKAPGAQASAPVRNWVAAASQAGLKPASMMGTAAARPVQSGTNTKKNVTPDWVNAVNSQVNLKPLSLDRVPAVKKVLADALDDVGNDSNPYKVAAPPSLPYVQSSGHSGGGPAGILTQAYKGQIGGLQGIMKWLNDSAYMLSIPFIAVLLFGVMFHNRPLALLGATLVVLLNISRLVTGLTNLVLIPFKDSPIQGILFLIPPIGIYYCMMHSKRVRKPLKRVLEPALTIAAVALAFMFVPWLRTGAAKPTGDLKAQIVEGAQEFAADIRKETGNLPDALKKLPETAGEAVKSQAPGQKNPPAKASTTQP